MNSVSKTFQTPKPVLVLFGPTASGKTALLKELFTGSNAPCRAEVVSVDSMQVYRGMDIGTAKPDASLRKILPHHLIDIRDPNEQFNAGDFVRLADNACAEIAARDALPVISGGTGFYLKNFILGLPDAPPSDPAIRDELKRELSLKGPAFLREELQRLDPVSAGRIHPNDIYRLLRALEVCRSGGRPLSSFAVSPSVRNAGGQALGRPEYRFIIACMEWPREELYRRINERCEQMFREGLAQEVASLVDRGYGPKDPGMRGIGYREFFVPGESDEKPVLSADLEGVKALVAQNSRHYAKRQITYFSAAFSQNRLAPVRLDGSKPQEALDLLAKLVHTLLRNH